MSKTNMAANRKYFINNAWLARYGRGGTAPDENRFVDIEEIKKTPRDSQYLQDLVAMGVTGDDFDYDQESKRAEFVVSGIRVGDGGTQIDGVLGQEHPTLDRFQNDYLLLLQHDEAFRRIYAWDTTARDIMWVGFGSSPRVFNT